MMEDNTANAEYELSYEILGHSSDVRVTNSFQLSPTPAREHVLTASRDGTCCVWAPEDASPREYILSRILKQHTGYISALCVIPAPLAAAYGQNAPLIVTGGQDKTILLHSTEEGMEEPLERYTGHTDLVTCVICMDGQVISCSWDSTIRVWKGSKQSEVISAHKPAVWAIASLLEFDGTRRILSGGADRIIRLWEVDTKLCVQEYHGHGDVVRDVKILSGDMFLSAANDCTIRKWNIHSGQCIREFFGHEAYVYSLSIFPGSGDEDFVSCGEDSSIRVWKGGECKQVIRVPATSVWNVWCMSNGDIVAGSSDAVARIFTTTPERMATPQELRVYEQKIKDQRNKSDDIDVTKLPGREALSNPGRAGGDTLMINNNGTAEVYQWSEENSDWVKIGNAVGKAPEKSNIYNGKEYDYVFDIELDEGSPSMRNLRLPYNRDMDPYIAAEEFLSANNLPSYYLDQVAEFIIQNAGEYQGPISSLQGDPFTGGTRYIPGGGSTSMSGTSDPFTGGHRYQPNRGPGGSGSGASGRGGGADPFTGGSSYRPTEFAVTDVHPPFQVSFKGTGLEKNPYFPLSDFKSFTSPKDYGDKIMGKINEFNSQEVQSLSSEQLARLQGLCVTLTSSPSEAISNQDMQLILLLLKWPPQYIFPGLDLLRLVMLTDCGVSHFIRDGDHGKVFLGELMAFAIGSQVHEKNQVLVLRTIANMFTKEIGVQLLHNERKWVLEQLQLLFSSSNRTNQIAIATLILNYCHYYSKTRDKDGFGDCVQFLIKIFKSSYDSEAKFRSLIGIGSLALVDSSLVKSLALPNDLCSLVQPLCATVDPLKVSQCAEFVIQALK